MSDIVKQGTYNGRCVSADLGKNSNGKEFARVTLKIAGGEYDGRTVSRDLYLSDKAYEYSAKALKTLGVTFDENNNLAVFDAPEVSFTVEHESYEDKQTGEMKGPFARVGFINSLAGGIKPEAQLSAAERAALKQRLMGALVSKPGVAKTGGTPPPF